MYSSYVLSKHLVTIPILVIQLFICSVSSMNLTNEYLKHKCFVHQGKYKPGSEYEQNLNHLFRSLSTRTYFQEGTAHTTFGKAPNSITVILQCRGDSYGSHCRSCVATATAEFHRRCPRDKGGMIWYDQCFLDVNMINEKAPRKINYENIFSLYNPNNLKGDTKSFNKNMKDLLYNLTLQAQKFDESTLQFYYAAGEKNLGTKKLYAIVQCVQDTSDCKGCLEWSIKKLFTCCNNKQGARVLGSNCNLRYELYPFLRA